jgi:hypothetical protein
MRESFNKVTTIAIIVILFMLTFGTLKSYIAFSRERKDNLRLAKEYVVENYEPNLKVRNLNVWRYGDKFDSTQAVDYGSYYYQVKWPRKASNGERYALVTDAEFEGFVYDAVGAGEAQFSMGCLLFVLIVVDFLVFKYWESIYDVIDDISWRLA